MEHFIVSARKYRPQIFEDVVGQQAITNTLENAIKNNHLAQALLFTGPRGVGKTTCARILAKSINQDGKEINPDEDVAFNKIYIIDEVHMLSQAAFNAFLKTLEEPPAHAIFILATTEKHKIIPTILSRCQIFDFKRIGVLDIKNYLKKIAAQESINADDDALHIIAQKADGALRDALSIFDRVVSFSGDNLTRQAVAENLNVLDYDSYFKTTDLILENDIPQLLITFNEILAKGFDGHHFIAGLASHYRDLLVAKDKATIALLEVGDNTKKQYLKQAENCSLSFLLQAIELANDCDLKYKTSKNQRLLVELALMQLASITFDSESLQSGEKKKSKQFIIPSYNFISISPSLSTKKNIEPQNLIIKENITNVVAEPNDSSYQTPKIEIKKDINPIKEIIKKPTLKTERRRSSALSLKSIHKKKETKNNIVDLESDNENKPKDSFTEFQFLELWNTYIEKLNKNGKKISASIMNTDVPRINNHTIELTFPNSMMKSELLKIRPKLLKHFREELNNYSIDFDITVNEENEKKFAYTPQEKYNKLLEKNKALAKLKSTFKLDL